MFCCWKSVKEQRNKLLFEYIATNHYRYVLNNIYRSICTQERMVLFLNALKMGKYLRPQQPPAPVILSLFRPADKAFFCTSMSFSRPDTVDQSHCMFTFVTLIQTEKFFMYSVSGHAVFRRLLNLYFYCKNKELVLRTANLLAKTFNFVDVSAVIRRRQ